MSVTAVTYSLGGETLSADEKAFFRDADPWGFTLFARNVDRPRQVRALTDALRDCVGRDAPIFIDQEGGRVQRLKAPTWRTAPAAARFGRLWDIDPESAVEAVKLNHQLLGAELSAVGVDVDYAPCADLSVPGAHDVIGDRAFHADAAAVAAMSTAALTGLLDQGVLGVIKHLPGHGRAGADSHLELPVVETPRERLETADCAAFAGIRGALMAMTAHVVYADIDPDDPATHSAAVIDQLIRGVIGFDGLLMSDDLSMQALRGDLQTRGERAISAGCDLIMHCNGRLYEMVQVAHAAPVLGGRAAERAEAALEARRAPAPFEVRQAMSQLDGLFTAAGLEAVS